MSFFTSLSYYRPCSPPLVTADDLSRFIAQICDTNTLTDSGLRLLHVKFGDSIDQDDKGTTWEEETAPGISVMHEIEWDVDLSDDPTHQDIIDALASDQRRIYRAFVMLGMPIDDVLRPITRENSTENEIDYYPDGLSFEIGPIECFNLASDQPLHVGWISLDLSGADICFLGHSVMYSIASKAHSKSKGSLMCADRSGPFPQNHQILASNNCAKNSMTCGRMINSANRGIGIGGYKRLADWKAVEPRLGCDEGDGDA